MLAVMLLLILRWLLCAPLPVAADSGPLHRKRVVSELRDIVQQNLSLHVPFNNSRDECGVRLSPISSNLLDWHFSFTGMEDSAYEGGIYHGRIRLSSEYPRKAPTISMYTASGRWEVGKDICLSGTYIDLQQANHLNS